MKTQGIFSKKPSIIYYIFSTNNQIIEQVLEKTNKEWRLPS